MAVLKKYWPFVSFSLLVLIFFWKFFLQGLLPIPADLITGGYYPWLDYKWGTLSGVVVKNPIQSDVVSVIYPIKLLAVELIKKGELPLWNWNMFAGYPLIANFQLGLFFPTMLFYFFLSIPLAWTAQVIMQPLLSLIFMYLFLRHLKLEKLPSVLGAVTYSFGGFALIWLEWNVLSTASAFLPLLLFLENKFLHTNDKKWGVFFSLALCMQIFAGYPQIVMFNLVALALWALVFMKSPKQGLALSLFVVLGVILASIILIPGFELFGASQRRFEEVAPSFRYLPWQNLLTFFAPDYFGNHATGNFWGVGEYTLMTVYSGLVAFILAFIYSLVNFRKIVSDKRFLFLVGLFVIAMLIMLPTPLGMFLYNTNLWGGPAASTTRVAFLVNFSISTLAALGLGVVMERYNKRNLRAGVVVLVFLILLTGFTYLQKSHFQSIGLIDQYQHFNIALHNLLFPLALALSVIFLLAISKFKFISKEIIAVGFIALTVMELFRFGWKFNSFSPQKYLYPETSTTSFLEKFPDKRIISGEVIPANMWAPYNLQSVAGYDAVYPLNWAKFTAVLNSNNPNATPNNRFVVINSYNSKLFDLTSTNFIIALKRDGKTISPQGQVDPQFLKPYLNKVFEDKSVVVFEDTQSLPRAFLVNKTTSVGLDQTYADLLKSDFDPRKIVLVNNGPNLNLEYPATSMVEYKTVTNNKVQVKTESSAKSFLVILNNFYPGWSAFVDGKPASLFQTDGAFWGVELPSGQHMVDFVYYPRSLVLGAILSLGSALTLLVVFFLPFKRLKLL